MEGLSVSIYLIAALFFFIAFIYTSVGLGGGSSYTALMAILGFNTVAIPLLSLVLNLFASTIGAFNFFRYGHARIKLILPFLVSSIPMAYLGGALVIPKQMFYWLLLVSLMFVAARIYFWKTTSLQLDLSKRQKISVAVISGGILGLIAGIVGIGGGIYLVPLIIILGLGSEKEAAACGAIFVWLNSASGLVSRLQYNTIDLMEYLPCILAVLAGAALGSFLGSSRLKAKSMEKLLGIIVVVAIVLLARKIMLTA